MSADPENERVAFFRRAAAIWLESRPAASTSRLQFLKELAKRAVGLVTVTGAPRPTSTADLELFRRLVVARPDDLRRRLLGANAEKLQRLSRRQRQAVHALGVSPDLLSPLGVLRYEPAHSALLAHFMGPRTNPDLSEVLLRKFLELADSPPETLEPENLRRATVSKETHLATGRVDLRVQSPRLVAYVEVKVDAEEGPAQLARYRAALDREAAHRTARLMFLTIPNAEGPGSNLDCTHVTFADLLVAWLPCLRIGGDAAEYLARYLKSVALLIGCASNERFDQWGFAIQRKALELIGQLDVEDL